MKDLLELCEAGVWLGHPEFLEELGHLRLPGPVHVGVRHPNKCTFERLCLEVTDEESVSPQEQRVVGPAGPVEGTKHVGPDSSMSFLVLLDPVLLHLELEAHALHEVILGCEGSASQGWFSPRVRPRPSSAGPAPGG